MFKEKNMQNHEQPGMNLRELLQMGVLKFAELPQGNPENLDYPAYTLSLIEHDYAAKTPIMWNEVYRKFGIEAGNIMLVGKMQNLPEILDALRHDAKYRGGGAGVGFKDEIVSLLDELDVLAEQIGAVNFVVKTEDNKLKGYNTDGIGYVKSLEEKFAESGQEIKGKNIVMLGSGGTGNAIAFMLAYHGANLVILNRNVQKAEQLAEKINAHFNKNEQKIRFGGEDSIAAEVVSTDAVVNVSTKGAMGQFADYFPLSAANPENLTENVAESMELLKNIPKTAILSDVVLRDGGTPFLKAARQLGFPVLDGIPMVVYQGVEAVWLLHGEELEKRGISKKQIAEVMKKAANFQ